MESGRILNSQLSASSSHDEESTGAQNSRIRKETGSGAWCPQNQVDMETKEWIQIDFTVEMVISAVETQGRFDGGRGMEYAPAYMIEYWRENLNNWARYKNNKHSEVILANTDTRSAVLRILDGGIIVKKIRIIPISESKRTVCMRLELYGCIFKDFLLWYSIPQGSIADGLNMQDFSYDGYANTSDVLIGGLGKLCDGVVGEDNFEKHPENWIGWQKDIQGSSVTMEFCFSEQRNISSISLHVSNFFKHQAQVFDWAHIWFFPLGNDIYSPRTIHYSYPRDSIFESARWVRIPISDRLVKKIKIFLKMAAEAKWLLLSHVPFDFAPNNNLMNQIIEPLNRDPLIHFSISDSVESYDRWYSTVFIIAIIVLSSIMSIFAYIACHYQRSNSLKSSLFDENTKDVQLMIVQGGTIKRVSPSAYRMTADNVENSLLEKMPICCDSGSEYADPDLAKFTDGTFLINHASSNAMASRHSMHYAASDIFKCIPSLDQTSNELILKAISRSKYMEYDNGCIPDFPNFVEIHRNNLKIKELLGKGEFGEVHLCQLENRLVAMKTLRPNADLQAQANFEKEIRIMSRLKHQNVVEVVGVCSEGASLCCIVEYMPKGDLCQYLQKQATVSVDNLLSICTQIAAGMSYLEAQNFVHRDLAARNCLIADDGTVKIADFGMARQLYDCDYYKYEGSFLLPIRWMAWECILLGKFTHKSDVWSFGVTMWEILNLCSEQPFVYLDDNEVIENIRYIYEHGQLKIYLEKPKYCRISFFQELIMPCWNRDDRSRPSFRSLHRRLQYTICSEPENDYQMASDFA
ncbi:unnamed protein product [Dracunculus medinensis]|uniref:receptor protein-tyrosine kinase n=1 Tax=Dracunculus medinensis TaxID=318479 RepID=A0A0N4UJD9_DRAME|nr:unnamed protein product [Dracunculus medinensis]